MEIGREEGAKGPPIIPMPCIIMPFMIMPPWSEPTIGQFRAVVVRIPTATNSTTTPTVSLMKAAPFESLLALPIHGAGDSQDLSYVVAKLDVHALNANDPLGINHNKAHEAAHRPGDSGETKSRYHRGERV